MYGESDIKLKGKYFSGIRIKLFMSFICSIVLATACIILFQQLFIQKISDAPRVEEEYSFIYFVVFLLLTSISFYFLSKNMIKRLERIHKSVKEIGAGNLDVYIEMEKHDEIGDVATGINEMTRSLKKLLEKEKRAHNMKNEMIGNISHDLRTPVTSLIGYVDLVEKNINDCEQYVPILKRKSYELKTQIDELLEYCQINYEEGPLQKERIGVKEIVEQVIIDFVPQLEEAEMDFRIGGPKNIKVEVDIKLFVRLLQNIISNSISYGKYGKKIDIQIAEKDQHAIVEIINYGAQIQEADIPYIFEKFYRGEKSRNAYTGGKGMGLAIAKSIADVHDGDITVYSDEEATKFTISIPKMKL